MRCGFLNCSGTLKPGTDLADASFFDPGVDVANGLAFLPDTFGVSARGDVLRRDGEGSMTTVLLASLGASGSGGRVMAFPAATRDQWPAGGVGIPALSHRSFSRWLATPYSRARWLMGDDHTFSYSRSRSIRVTGAPSATIPLPPVRGPLPCRLVVLRTQDFVCSVHARARLGSMSPHLQRAPDASR